MIRTVNTKFVKYTNPYNIMLTRDIKILSYCVRLKSKFMIIFYIPCGKYYERMLNTLTQKCIQSYY